MNRINSIQIQNFKSIKDMKLEDCRRVNVFIGYPNVGKSNILEAMSMLGYLSKENRHTGLKELVRLERLSQLFNFNNVKEPVSITFNNDFSLSVAYKNEKRVDLSLEDGKKLKPYNFHFLNLKAGKEGLANGSKTGTEDFKNRFPALQNLIVKPYKFSDDKVFTENFSALSLKVPYGKNLFELIVNNANIQDEFRKLLKPYNLQLVIDRSENDVKISPAIQNGIINTIPISLMAETLIRLIFFITAIETNWETVLLFEEPESHMFPPYVTNFTSKIIYDKNGNQYFIATHSPFVLIDFIENMTADDLAIYAVGLENSETKVRKLTEGEISDVSEYGIDLFFNLENYI